MRKEHSIGFVDSSSGADVEKLLIPFLDTLANFREEARQSAFAMIKSCDDLRDRVLPDLGVRFEDKPGQTSHSLSQDISSYLFISRKNVSQTMLRFSKAFF